MVRSLQKGIDILKLFGKEMPLLSVEEIARATDISLPTAYRFVATLKRNGLVERDPSTGRYMLGLRILELGKGVFRKVELETVAAPLLKRLAVESGETVQLTKRHADYGICIDVEESPSALRVAPEKGNMLPLHAGASVQVILAFLPEKERDRISSGELKKITDYTIINSQVLQKRLACIQKEGFALTSSEVYLGSVGLAAPIFNGDNRAIASVAISGPSQRMDQEKCALLKPRVIETAKRISEALKKSMI
jgi:IclR family KDG regulon transcriptional repressor